jgi:hypothetical protein
MAIRLLTRRRGRPGHPVSASAMSDEAVTFVGDDSGIMSCPSCARPLATGTRRCPGCGTHLIMGVQAKRASLFMVAGAAAGLMVGGSVTGLVVSSWRSAPAAVGHVGPSASPAPGVTASAAPSASASTGPDATAPSTIPTVPFAVASALRQSTQINASLTASIPLLKAELKGTFDAEAVAATLRGIAASASQGKDLSPRLEAWPDGSVLIGQMSAFYNNVLVSATSGLSVTTSNAGAYKSAAQRMIKLLGSTTAFDATVRTAAAAAGVQIPPAP